MPNRLLICTDLDRTLIPNGAQAESPACRRYFARLVESPAVVLAYVSGRHRKLVEQAIAEFSLPMPDYVIGDVGTTIYRVGQQQAWQHQLAWEDQIAEDWRGLDHAAVQQLLHGITELRPQEDDKQNRLKLSYYVDIDQDHDALAARIQQRFASAEIDARLIWSVDEPAATGLLDILPASASKLHAIEALMDQLEFGQHNTVFCGDSGNDLEVLVSPIKSVLVANAQEEVKHQASKLAQEYGTEDRLYIAQGGFANMNGNYSAGMLEGIAYLFPQTTSWMGLDNRG